MMTWVTEWDAALGVFLVAGVLWSLLLLAVAWIGVPTFERISQNTARRVLANSTTPLISQLTNRAVDLVFAAFMLRLLGVAGNGQFAIAVVTWLYLKTIVDFGLSVLVTREAALHPERAGRLLGASTLLRLGILAALLPIVATYAIGGIEWFALSPESAIAIGLLTLSIVPGSYTEAVNSVFNARERMEFPAVLNVLTNLARAAFGLAALVAGYGVIGLVGVSVLVTTISALAYHLSLRHIDVQPEWRIERAEATLLLSLSWPLLLNALLMNLFFRVDVFIIQATQGDHALGIYDAAYKYINMLLLVPAYVTLAVFPILSRLAISDRDRMVDHFRLAAKLLFIIAWPITLGTMALAPFMIRVLGGDAFLPDSATALRVLIWFAPLSYVNGVVQYVLIAVNHQRTISVAFAIAVGFNLLANLLLVPRFGYLAAAGITVATEVVLFVCLALAVRRFIGPVGWPSLAARPLVSAAAMAAAMLAAAPLGPALAVALGLAAYLASLILTGAVGAREATIVRALIGRSSPALS